MTVRRKTIDFSFTTLILLNTHNIIKLSGVWEKIDLTYFGNVSLYDRNYTLILQ